MNKYLSLKLRVLSLFALVFVLYIHSKSLGNVEKLNFFNEYVQTLFISLWSSAAVPFFFFVSGLLFAVHLPRTFSNYKQLLVKKVHGLVIPYFLWGVLGGLIVLPLIAFANHVAGRPLFERTIFTVPLTIWDVADRLLGITRAPVGNVALWYVRNLVAIFLFSPLFVAVLRIRVLAWAVCFLCILWPDDYPFEFLTFACFTTRGCGWFLMGCLVFLKNKGLSKPESAEKEQWRFWVLISFICLSMCVALVCVHGGVPVSVGQFLPNIFAVFGIFTAWACYDWVYAKCNRVMWKKWLSPFLNVSFWVYCMHGFVIGYFNAIPGFVFGKNNLAVGIMFFFSPVFAFFICVLVGKFLQKKWPGCYSVLSGGR